MKIFKNIVPALLIGAGLFLGGCCNDCFDLCDPCGSSCDNDCNSCGSSYKSSCNSCCH